METNQSSSTDEPSYFPHITWAMSSDGYTGRPSQNSWFWEEATRIAMVQKNLRLCRMP